MKRKFFFFWLATLFLSALILSGVFLPAIFIKKNPGLARFIFSLYAPLCHQRPERCYQLGGQQLAVCSRCLGVYTGFFISTLLYPFFKPRLKIKIGQKPNLLIWFALPMAADVLAGWLNLWASPLPFKTLTGLLWAAILPFFWFKAIDDFFQ